MPLFMLVLAVAITPLLAGEIFGDIRVGDQAVAQAPLQLTCGGDTARGTTDAEGTFRLASKTGGKCTLTVTHQKSAASVEVIVFDKPARYRLKLEPKDGGWVLKRV